MSTGLCACLDKIFHLNSVSLSVLDYLFGSSLIRDVGSSSLRVVTVNLRACGNSLQHVI